MVIYLHKEQFNAKLSCLKQETDLSYESLSPYFRILEIINHKGFPYMKSEIMPNIWNFIFCNFI